MLIATVVFVAVSCGQLIKQAIADGTQQGLACKPYVEKGINGQYRHQGAPDFSRTINAVLI